MSRLIKSFQYVPVEALKQLELNHHYLVEEESVDEPSETAELHSRQDEEAERLRSEMLNDAKAFAEQQVRSASEQAEQMLEEARQQIEQWWQERREQDEHLQEALKAEGYQQGYEEGRQMAEQEMQQQLEQVMGEAQQVLQQSYEAKEQLIQEAEPFLVELSCSIAEKVIEKQLSIEEDYMIELIRKSLARKREQGTIVLCVSPAHFSFVHAAREELTLAIDSQADLQILPDATVKDRGCVIRSSFGSVDARIDTQLTEIKKELIRVALDDEERRNQDEGA
ncbi:FliH/SctL family protein [Paenibacillus sp. JX-17]|uniref:FliH/SctL family protein n=1 Tax=Paenibacillus lacisoli TaxID=3064525 RepID=A0ABT9C9A8_9BACL|nr:FliH/SctL family protein [Paenibacillus sp. JX-17]MDO7905834.1 FliH/SctL family protein [Paenibacillus sp. JX-17]